MKEFEKRKRKMGYRLQVAYNKVLREIKEETGVDYFQIMKDIEIEEAYKRALDT